MVVSVLIAGQECEVVSGPSQIRRMSVSPSPAFEEVLAVFDSLLPWLRPYQCESANSLDEVNGPSVTLNFPPDCRTRTPFARGRYPSVGTHAPDFIDSSLSVLIFVISSSVGGVPSGLLGLYTRKNLIVMTLLSGVEFGLRASLKPHLRMNTSNARPANRRELLGAVSISWLIVVRAVAGRAL